MSLRADNHRRFGLWALILAAVVGLALGLFAAWVVWPVEWTDTDPVDLRIEHQKTHILLVADSYAINGDVPLAQRRLQDLAPDGRDLAAVTRLADELLAERLAEGDAAAAARLKRLVDDTGLQSNAATAAPSEEPGQQGSEDRMGRGAPNWVMILFGLGALLVGLAAVVGLLLSRRGSRDKGPEYPVFDARLEPLDERPNETSTAPGQTPTSAGPSLEELLGIDATALSSQPAPQPARVARDVPPWEGVDEDDAIVPPAPSQVKVNKSGVLREYDIAYRYGDDDFYQSVTIDSPEESFIGQCGMVISEVLGSDDAQQVAAFDVWLFETQGTRTVSQVLASPWAARNESIVARLERKGEVVTAEPGLALTLETDSLRLTAQITALAYQHHPQFPEAIFERLAMHFRIEQMAT